jgi:ATP-binding cassette subfamily D (ALD) long-chain fatty acid import protein
LRYTTCIWVKQDWWWIALITISTRASLKRYHTYTLTLGIGDDGLGEYDFQRIGTESEKSSVDKELAELRERLAKVEEWKRRKGEIEEELSRVWVQGKDGEEGGELAPPGYLESERAVESTSDEDAAESLSEQWYFYFSAVAQSGSRE